MGSVFQWGVIALLVWIAWRLGTIVRATILAVGILDAMARNSGVGPKPPEEPKP